MLTQAIGDLLPAAVAVALSPIPIVAVVLMLGTTRARSNGPSFAVGWVAGLSVVSAVVLLLTHGASNSDSATATSVDWLQVGLGVLFLVMALRQWRKRPAPRADPELPSWMTKVDSFGPLEAAGLGVVLSAANPKNLALTLAASASIAQAGLSAGQDVIAVAVFVVLASSTTVGLVIYYLVASHRATAALTRVKDFMARNNAVIMMVVLLLIGAKLLGEGLGNVAR
jgi:threonine/homoserine/homoserine lactone efflux protein